MKTDTHIPIGKTTQKVAGLQVLTHQCVWMRAGVINFHICENHFDCRNCPFDRSMRNAMAAQDPPRGKPAPRGWAREMRRKYTGVFKPCCYYLTGEIGPPGRCDRDYACDECPVEMALGYAPMTDAIAKTGTAAEKRNEPAPAADGHENECIWMRAGVVNFHLCDRDYDCRHCTFDDNMRAAMAADSNQNEKSGPTSWEQRMDHHFETINDLCIHHMAGRKDAPRVCTEKHACASCSVHRKLSGRKKVFPMPLAQPKMHLFSGFNVADGYYYHFGHTWVNVIHGKCVRIGVDDFILKVFGPTKGVLLPPDGASVAQGNVAWVMTRNGHRAPIQCPLSGKILSLNHEMMSDATRIHHDPYGSGWLVQMEPENLNKELETLYFGETSHHWLEQEYHSLLQMMGPQYEKLAATGAETAEDLYGSVPGLAWKNLLSRFLHTREKH